MGKILENLNMVLLIGIVAAVALVIAPFYAPATLAIGLLQWLHVFFGVLWIGLLYYFNFVQIPTMPTIPAELKPGVSKYIAPKALFYFPWGAAFTVLSGLAVAESYGYLVAALCEGINIEITDKSAVRALDIFVHAVHLLKKHNGADFTLKPLEIRKMTGSCALYEMLEAGAKPAEIIAAFEKDNAGFKAGAAKFLLYK